MVSDSLSNIAQQNRLSYKSNMIKKGIILSLLMVSVTIFAKQQVIKSKIDAGFKQTIKNQRLPLKTVPFFDGTTELFYGIYNDTTSIYLLFQTNKAETAQAIARSGFEFSITYKQKEKCTANIKYLPADIMGHPNRESAKRQPPSGDRAMVASPSNKEMSTEVLEKFNLNIGQFLANGFYRTNGLLSMDNPRTINVEVYWPEMKYFNIWVRIPINEITNETFDWEHLSSKGLKASMELTSKNNMIRQMAHEDGMNNDMGGEGPRGGGGAPGGNMGGGTAGRQGKGHGGEMPNGASSTSKKLSIAFTLSPQQ